MTGSSRSRRARSRTSSSKQPCSSSRASPPRDGQHARRALVACGDARGRARVAPALAVPHRARRPPPPATAAGAPPRAAARRARRARARASPARPPLVPPCPFALLRALWASPARGRPGAPPRRWHGWPLDGRARTRTCGGRGVCVPAEGGGGGAEGRRRACSPRARARARARRRGSKRIGGSARTRAAQRARARGPSAAGRRGGRGTGRRRVQRHPRSGIRVLLRTGREGNARFGAGATGSLRRCAGHIVESVLY